MLVFCFAIIYSLDWVRVITVLKNKTEFFRFKKYLRSFYWRIHFCTKSAQVRLGVIFLTDTTFSGIKRDFKSILQRVREPCDISETLQTEANMEDGKETWRSDPGSLNSLWESSLALWINSCFITSLSFRLLICKMGSLFLFFSGLV